MFDADSTNTQVTSKLLARDNSGLIMSGTLIRKSRRKHDTKTTAFSDFVFAPFPTVLPDVVPTVRFQTSHFLQKAQTSSWNSLKLSGSNITDLQSRLGQSFKG